MSERIRFECSGCGRLLSVAAVYAGRTFRCPTCGVVDRVPGQRVTPELPKAATPKEKYSQAPVVAETSPTVSPGTPIAAVAAPTQPIPAPPQVIGPPGPEEQFQPVRLRRTARIEAEMDMTPMVDVTFLLLIFFMVTAAYSLQKSLEMPSPDRQEEAAEARTIEELETDSDYIIVRIARDNTVWVNDVEAPSQQEVLARLREARNATPGSRGPSNLLVLADPEAKHETVVMVLDAGNAVGMENIRLACVEEDAL
ncbi:MAG: biopolymer transporter ExbD [Thermoguttaceae bacterium]|nr:biopolymer transporter ExbD [Thermoguttaceae bacterium]MDW8079003.1 biopolymer transporter ExbD [Thermoguttaceae bacterium]